MIHKTIKKVTEDIEGIKYNTAISTLMTLVNSFNDTNVVSRKDYRIILQLLNPFSPHITEELNEKYNLGDELAYSTWPTYDSNKIVDETFELVVQVNGKVRGKITVDNDVTEDQMKSLAKDIDNVKKYIEEKEIVKEIVVPKKLVNIVVK